MRVIRSHRRLAGVVIVLIAGALTWIGLGLRFYAFPDQRPVTRSDVVFVIGPPDVWRIRLAEQYLADGLAGALMVSEPFPGVSSICARDEPFPVLCERPSPFTTQGEARWLRDEMRSRGWSTAIVITSTPHVVRTEVRMERCVPEGVNVVGRPEDLTPTRWAYQFVYQTAAFAKVVLQPGC